MSNSTKISIFTYFKEEISYFKVILWFKNINFESECYTNPFTIT